MKNKLILSLLGVVLLSGVDVRCNYKKSFERAEAYRYLPFDIISSVVCTFYTKAYLQSAGRFRAPIVGLLLSGMFVGQAAESYSKVVSAFKILTFR